MDRKSTHPPKTLRLALLMACCLVTGVLVGSVTADDDDGDRDNLIAIHRSPRGDAGNCVACHSDVLDEQSLDPGIPGAHVAMLPFTPGEKDEDKCVFCHRTVNLVQGTQLASNSDGSLRKRIDTALCTMCHGPSGLAAPQFYQSEVTDGATLYDLACAACHRPLANSKVSGESVRDIQKKISENEGGMGPLSALTDEQIQAIADALARPGRNGDD